MADTLGMLGHYPPWFADASCSQIGGDWWFPERGEPTGPAKRICARCPVIQECDEFATRNRIVSGVWGGRSERQRRALLRRQRAGDPV